MSIFNINDDCNEYDENYDDNDTDTDRIEQYVPFITRLLEIDNMERGLLPTTNPENEPLYITIYTTLDTYFRYFFRYFLHK